MTRRIVYFLGAGASFGAGATASVQAGAKIPIPTQATFWGTFLRFCKSDTNRKDIESFLFRYFLGYNKVPSRLTSAKRRVLLAPVDVEEVFTFLSERVRAPSTSTQLRTYSIKIWKALVTEIGNVFRRFKPNHRTRAVYRKFISTHCNLSDTIVSFNYDTIFETSLPARERMGCFGIEGSDGSRLLKPHGSVDWEISDQGSISITAAPQQSVIVAPTHLKFVTYSGGENTNGYLDQSSQIGAIWAEMERRMRQAESLVFIGYSFPIADLYFSSVLRSVLADRDTSPNLVIVNPDAVAISTRIQQRFSLPSVLKYFDLEQFLQAPRNAVFAKQNQ